LSPFRRHFVAIPSPFHRRFVAISSPPCRHSERSEEPERSGARRSQSPTLPPDVLARCVRRFLASLGMTAGGDDGAVAARLRGGGKPHFHLIFLTKQPQ
jgi:hypothetical protein